MPILYRVPLPADGDRAIDLFERIMEKAGDGTHNLVICVQGIGGTITRSFPFIQHDDVLVANEEKALHFLEMLTLAVSGAHTGGAILRTQTSPGTYDVCAWHFQDGDPRPLNRAEVFNAYCTDVTGEIIPPEQDVEYKDAPIIHL
ncbi:hypothetical protein ACWGIN_27910 [Streptomyces sp. NPDC054861]